MIKMALPRMSLKNFMVHAKSSLKTAVERQQKVTLVIGNESCDLDSLSSSLLYGYIRSLSPPKQAFTPLYIPLVHIQAADISIRPEFKDVLLHANLEAKHLITLDDLPQDLKKDLPPDRTKWILVDHNALQGELSAEYSSRVGGVIDHHVDERKVPSETGAEPRIIEKSGSCSSLVTNYLQESWDELDNSEPGNTHHGAPNNDFSHNPGTVDDVSPDSKVWDGEVAKLAIASVLIDTANLTFESKTTLHDKKAAAYLEAKIRADPRNKNIWDCNKFYEEISKAKDDLDPLSLRDILRKDYKEWKSGDMTLGISSVVKSLPYLMEKASSEAQSQGKATKDTFDKALQDYAAHRGLQMYAICTAFTSDEGEFTRELLLWGLTDEAAKAAIRFETAASDELKLEDWSDDLNLSEVKEGWRKVWWQRHVEHSRKKIAPLIREAMG